MLRLRRISASLTLVAGLALCSAVAAQAGIVVSHDTAGRSITFDVRAPGADVAWYTALLSSAPHGNEISKVTVRIVPQSTITSMCGAGAAACYENRVIVVPIGHDVETAHDLLHEYGHHLDSFWPVAGVEELNGTPVWWQLRGMAALLAQGRVAFDYSLGWDRSIGEVFAEDYAYIQLGDSYGIRWLAPPDATLKAALLGELGGSPAPQPPVSTPPRRPVVAFRGGFLRPGARSGIPFRLLGPGRHVVFTASVAGSRTSASRARLEVVCDGTLAGSTDLAAGRRTASLELSDLGPGSCEADLVSTSSSTLRYSAQLRLSLEQG